MRFEKPVSIAIIAQLIGAELLGNTNGNATGINEIHKVEAGDLVFVDHPKYYSTCINSAATFIIINKKMDWPEGPLCGRASAAIGRRLFFCRRVLWGPTGQRWGDQCVRHGAG